MAKLTLKERLEQKKKERAYLKKLEEQDGVDGYDIRKSVDREGIGKSNTTKSKYFIEIYLLSAVHMITYKLEQSFMSTASSQ